MNSCNLMIQKLIIQSKNLEQLLAINTTINSQKKIFENKDFLPEKKFILSIAK